MTQGVRSTATLGYSVARFQREELKRQTPPFTRPQQQHARDALEAAQPPCKGGTGGDILGSFPRRRAGAIAGG